MTHKTLAQKVDWLFTLCLDERDRQFTYGHVQRATNSRITASYVWKLRTGTMSNPGLCALQALADFFDVPLTYFAEGGEYLEKSIRVAHALHGDGRPRQEALRILSEHASTLSDRALAAVLEMTEYLHHFQEQEFAPIQEPALAGRA